MYCISNAGQNIFSFESKVVNIYLIGIYGEVQEFLKEKFTMDGYHLLKIIIEYKEL